MIALPVIDANDMLIEAQLGDAPYYIGLSWNETGGFWALGLRDLNREVLVSGISAVPNWPLLRQVRRPELPPGELVVGAAPDHAMGRRSFADGSAVLVYFDEDDLAELTAGG